MSGSASGVLSPVKPTDDNVPAMATTESKVQEVESVITGSPMQLESSSSPPSLPTPHISNTTGKDHSDHASSGEIAGDRGGSAKSDSEAETIVLPGKENDASPAKQRSIKHEEGVRAVLAPQSADVEMKDAGGEESQMGDVDAEEKRKRKKKEKEKKKRKKELQRRDDEKVLEEEGAGQDAGQDAGHSSDLSSVLSSPTTGDQSSKKDHSESEDTRTSPSERHQQDIPVPAEATSRKRKFEVSGDHREQRDRHPSDTHDKSRQSDRGAHHGTAHSNSSAALHSNERFSPDRSTSPRTRPHRRAASNQFTSYPVPLPHPANGKSHKKRSAVTPTLTTGDERSWGEAASEDSDTSASPHPTTHRPKPHHAHDSTNLLSPVKMAPHKKHRDQIGRTFLARACAANETENVKIRLQERPEDIDIADNAGNTPLQISSLEGSAEIVRLLIEHGCDIECKNHEKDTPLIDAVENGHMEVVRLLLAAGANPRQGNLNGEEALDLLDPDDPHYPAIRDMLNDAKDRANVRRASEDHGAHNGTTLKEGGRSSRGTSAVSPRPSPPPLTHPRSPPTTVGVPPRRKTVRSEATRNDLLWMKPTAENLLDRAGKGDMAGVANILNVLSQADPEALIAAARGGHDEVIQLLLGIGGADADADPLRSLKAGFNTPMLAAIGRGSEKVIQLLLEQPKFDPTRRDQRGHTYHEIAKERQGLHWEREYEILKAAYDRARGRKVRLGHGKKSSSPTTARVRPREDERDIVREKEKTSRTEPAGTTSSTAHVLKKKVKSLTVPGVPGKDSHQAKESRREGEKKATPKHQVSAPIANMTASRPEMVRLSSSAVSDGDQSTLRPPRETGADKPQRSQSEATAVASDEEAKPRRKLVSGKELKGDRAKKRRSSNVSTVSHASSGPVADAPREEVRSDDAGHIRRTKPTPTTNASKTKRDGSATTGPPRSSVSDSDLPGDHSVARDKMIKREDSKDRLSVIRSEGRAKRPRISESPVRSRSRETESRPSDADELSRKKRRRLEIDAKLHTKKKRISDQPATEEKSPPLTIGKSVAVAGDRDRDRDRSGRGESSRPAKSAPDDRPLKENKPTKEASLKAIRPEAKDGSIKSARPSLDRDGSKESVSRRESSHDRRSSPDREGLAKRREVRRKDEASRAEAARLDAVRLERENSERQAKEEKEMLAMIEREQAEKQLRDEYAATAKAKREVEEARRQAEADEAAAVAAQTARDTKAEADRKAEFARFVMIARAEMARQEEEEQDRRDRLAREQAAVQAQEAERQRRMELVRMQAELEQRQREEAEQSERLRRLERDRRHRESLPCVLQRISEQPADVVRTPDAAKQFLPLYSVTASQISLSLSPPPDPSEGGRGEAASEEKYMTNFEAAVIFGNSDLALTQYPNWTRVPITPRHKALLYRAFRFKLQDNVPLTMHCRDIILRDQTTQAKFRAMEPVFWIRVTDFFDATEDYEHLRELRSTVDMTITIPMALDTVKLSVNVNGTGSLTSGPKTDEWGWTVTGWREEEGGFETIASLQQDTGGALKDGTTLKNPTKSSAPLSNGIASR